MQSWENSDYLTIAAVAKVIPAFAPTTGLPCLDPSYPHNILILQHFVGYAFDSDFAAGGNDSDVRFHFNAGISTADMRQARVPR